MQHVLINASGSTVSAGGEEFLSIIQDKDSKLSLASPAFSIHGMDTAPVFTFDGTAGEKKLRNGGSETTLRFQSGEEITLLTDIQTFPGSPVVRFRYRLCAEKPCMLSKPAGRDNLVYTRFSVPNGEVTELQFSQYIPHMHRYIPQFAPVDKAAIKYGVNVPGPALIYENASRALALGYEHGAQYPDSYLEFGLKGGDGMQNTVSAKKGNYFAGQRIDRSHAFSSVWFHVIPARNREDLLTAYRHYLGQWITQNAESRKPYIFYNTWNHCERDHNVYGTPSYFTNVHLQWALAEIDAAHEIGIDVFVIDTGWFTKTGDWLVELQRFPDGLKEIRAKLESYNMKLGLWFNPTVAAKTSGLYSGHPEYVMNIGGKDNYAGNVWETEESYGMCICTDYWKAYADKMIELHDTLGVSYFKWDGIGQGGCDSPNHDHGGPENSPQERAECYGYLMGRRMIQIANRITEKCPDAIIDFDVTEAGRFVGFGFLEGGKYFLVNNGPYAGDFDQPAEFTWGNEKPVPLNPWYNVFFYPGAARPRFCRTGASFDRFVPANLFLTHFYPDGDLKARQNSLASMVLGGNGIWGHLSVLTEDEAAFWKKQLSCYKQVRDAVTSVPARVTGVVGSSPEIYEKIDHDAGTGVLVFFTCISGAFSYIVGPVKSKPEIINADTIEDLGEGFLRITVNLEYHDARTVFFLR
jgi:alpha-galactosidase